ncbi:hypothetical protein ACS0TY_013572 [Phlomoides rotata]
MPGREQNIGQKVSEVEKLTQTVRELEEVVLAEGAAANVVREYEKKVDKVMLVKQWLEERKFYQGEIQHLKDKMAVAERAAKAEAQFKEKYQLRFKVLQERLKGNPNSINCALSQGRKCVSGTLYDMLQKEVIILRKVCHEKDQSINDKDDAIKAW